VTDPVLEPRPNATETASPVPTYTRPREMDGPLSETPITTLAKSAPVVAFSKDETGVQVGQACPLVDLVLLLQKLCPGLSV